MVADYQSGRHQERVVHRPGSPNVHLDRHRRSELSPVFEAKRKSGERPLRKLATSCVTRYRAHSLAVSDKGKITVSRSPLLLRLPLLGLHRVSRLGDQEILTLLACLDRLAHPHRLDGRAIMQRTLRKVVNCTVLSSGMQKKCRVTSLDQGSRLCCANSLSPHSPDDLLIFAPGAAIQI
jgi:hypothetical protein